MPAYTEAPVKGRTLQEILDYHQIPLEAFEGAVVYDLGCGTSNLGAELALRGIHATVTGFDIHPEALSADSSREGSTIRRYARLDDLPVDDESADIAMATYSLPFWAKNSKEISGFFREGSRVPRVGGIFSVFPMNVAGGILFDVDEPTSSRWATMIDELDTIKSSGWVPLTADSFQPNRLMSVRKVAKYVG